MLFGMSYEELRDKIFAALNPGEESDWWIRDLYETHLIAEDAHARELYQVPYEVSDSGEITVSLDRRAKVQVEYVQVVNSVKMVLKSDGSLPTEIQLIPYGHHDTVKGPFFLDDEGASLIMAAFEEQKNDAVIDYEHQTLEGGEAPAAGWIKALINKGEEGIWGTVEWTARATEYLKNREYRYLSPVFLRTIKEGRAVKLINAGLTNAPAIDGMVPVVNKQTHQEVSMKFFKQLVALLAMKAGATEQEVLEAVKTIMAAHKDTLAQLGLKPEATVDEVKDAVMVMKAAAGEVVTIVAAKEVMDALDLKEGSSLSEVTGTIMALKKGSEGAGEMAKELAALKKRLDTSDAEALVTQAMKDGKVVPAQKEWALKYAQTDPEGFKTYVAKAPQLVVSDEVVTGVAQPGGVRTDEVQASVNKALGVSDEMYKEHGPGRDGDDQ